MAGGAFTPADKAAARGFASGATTPEEEVAAFRRELGYRRPLPRKTPQFRSRDDYYILETTVLRNNDHGRCGGFMHRNDKHLRSSVGEERCGNASVLWSGNFDIPVLSSPEVFVTV